MNKVTEKHIEIISGLMDRVEQDRSAVYAILTEEDRQAFQKAINDLQNVKRRFKIALLQQQRINVDIELEKLNNGQ